MAEIDKMLTEIRKSQNIVDLIDNIEPGKIEVITPAKVEGNSEISNLVLKYEKLLESGRFIPNNPKNFVQDKNYYCANKKIKIPEVISNNEMNVLLRLISIKYSTEDDYKYRITGLFFSKLIQNSYNSGSNNFHFQLSDIEPFRFFVSYLAGIEDNPLEVKIISNDKWDKILTIGSKHCNFYLESMPMFYHFNTLNREIIAPRFCKFKTSDEESLRRMLSPMKIPHPNKVIFVEKDGEEKVIREY